MNKISGMLLAVLFLVTANAWGACTSNWVTIVSGSACACDGPDFTPRPSTYSMYASSVASLSSNCFAGPYVCGSQSQCVVTGYSKTCCSDEREADSLKCVRDGNVWQGGTCKINHCKAADSTWLSTSIAACTGSNNYAIVNTDSTCEHAGTCCPNDSIPSGNTCKWRCDSVLTTCNGRTGDLLGGVLPDTSVSGQDTTFSYQCYYNCSHSPNPDSTVYLVEGNIVLSGPSDSIPDGIKSETFNSVRTTTGGVYIYDYLSPSASEYIDSIAAMKCAEHLWRCVINNKYVYWYDNQEVPAGCTNIVRVK